MGTGWKELELSITVNSTRYTDELISICLRHAKALIEELRYALRTGDQSRMIERYGEGLSFAIHMLSDDIHNLENVASPPRALIKSLKKYLSLIDDLAGYGLCETPLEELEKDARGLGQKVYERVLKRLRYLPNRHMLCYREPKRLLGPGPPRKKPRKFERPDNTLPNAPGYLVTA